MAERSTLVGFIAHCKNCGWETQDHINGPQLAAGHANQNGHVVTADKTYAVTYGKAKP